MTTDNLLLFILVGFLAQIIDGSLGMAYGVSANSFLLTIGVSPAAASASLHASEVFTTAVSGLSHWQFGNVDRQLVKRLAIPGILGGITGAYLLVHLPGEKIKPYVSAYLLLMGLRILWKAFNHRHETIEGTRVPLIPLGYVGGLFDAIGGGGWGPIVTTTLIANGTTPRKVIGSVNLTEFFVTFCETVTFLLTLGFLEYWKVILGLMIGGGIAAPMGAFLTSHIPTRPMLFLVGSLIIFLSLRTILAAL
jgi:uncharacterized membrane protein YfcA